MTWTATVESAFDADEEPSAGRVADSPPATGRGGGRGLAVGRGAPVLRTAVGPGAGARGGGQERHEQCGGRERA